MITKINPLDLKQDFNLYPRKQIDSSLVAAMYDAFQIGKKFPPIIADKDTKRTVDGFHRTNMYLKHMKEIGKPIKIDVEFKTYNSDKEIYLDALRYNCNHGKRIIGDELAHAIKIGLDMDIKTNAIASAMSISIDKINTIIPKKIATITLPISLTTSTKNIPKRRTTIKKSFEHLTKNISDLKETIELTEKEIKVIERGSGAPQWLQICQVCDLLENEKLLNQDDYRVQEQIKRLKKIIKKY